MGTNSDQSAFFCTDEAEITIIHNGRLVTIPADHSKHDAIWMALQNGLYDCAILMSDRHEQLAQEVAKYSIDGLELSKTIDGKILFNNRRMSLHVGEKAIELLDNNMPLRPLLLFLRNLQQNPDMDVQEDLLNFLAVNDFAIDNKGMVIAWKKVLKLDANHYVDQWTKQLDYTPPKTLTMPRECVEKDSSNSCGRGFHFATWRYTYNYGGSTVVELQVHPKHVVSIPRHEREKGRCSDMKIVREIPDWEQYNDIPPSSPSIFRVSRFTG